MPGRRGVESLPDGPVKADRASGAIDSAKADHPAGAHHSPSLARSLHPHLQHVAPEGSVLHALLVRAVVADDIIPLGNRLEAWSVRGPLFLLGAVVVFAATVRPLGLAFAGPLAVILASLADRDTKLKEVVPFALLLSAACILLFKYALRQPIPVAPLVLGY